jgi:hypothetical protein
MKGLNTYAVCALVFCGLWASLSNVNSAKLFAQQAPSRPDITAELVKPHVVKLADDKYEGRGAGYPGERKAADYIAAEFKRIGLTPGGDNVRGRRSYFQEFKFQPWHPVVPWEVLSSRNVLGLIEGTDPILKNEIVVIGAHYDGQGRTGQADPVRLAPSDVNATKDEIWNSANDNAASIASILEIARHIKNGKINTRRSLLFIAFGAEEHGMAGSLHYVSHPVFPLHNHVAMINLEKVGRSPEKALTVTGGASSSVWQQVFKTAGERTGMKVAPGSPYSFPDSDHYPFAASRIPAIMLLVPTSVDSHQPSDSWDKIDFSRVAEVARYSLATLLELANQQQTPDFIASPIPDLGLIAHLITAAESDAAGLGAEESGLKVTGVVAGLPSAAAGLQPGDLILEFAKRRFRRDDTVAALMAVHRQILEGKLGDRLPVTILRNKKQSELVINLRK